MNSTENPDENDLKGFLSICKELKSHVKTEYAAICGLPGDNNDSDIPEPLEPYAKELLKLIQCLEVDLVHSATYLFKICHLFDFEGVRANGYRSFLTITKKCATNLMSQLRVKATSTKFPFSLMKKEYSDRVLAYIQCFLELSCCIEYLVKLSSAVTKVNVSKATDNLSLFSEDKRFSLFPNDDLLESEELKLLIDQSEKFNQEVFFGHCLGFYYCASSKHTLVGLATLMTAYGDYMEVQVTGDKTAETSKVPVEPVLLSNSLTHAKTTFKKGLATMSDVMNNVIDPSKRAQRMTILTRYAPVQFCKQFWGLTDSKLAISAPLLVVPKVAIGFNFSIACETLNLEKNLEILPPSKSSTVRLRLLCTSLREEQHWAVKNSTFRSDCGSVPWPLLTDAHLKPQPDVPASSGFGQLFSNLGWRNVLPSSDWLLFHCHGGGFVGQSAQAHDVYLRFWAQKLDCPIISVEYSLAPEHPFPIAIEEAFFAYCWAVKNSLYLGTKAKKIILCGDSAGGNIVLGVLQKIIASGVVMPHGILLVYTPVLISFTPSPARLMSIMDPLLPIGILSRCLLAYAGVEEANLLEEFHGVNRNVTSATATAIDDSISLTNISQTNSETAVENKTEDLLSTCDNLLNPLTILRSVNMPKDPLMSPWYIQDDILSQFPTTVIFACHLDPLLDDSIEFAKRLHSVNVPTTLRVMDDVSHGFLNFSLLSPESRAATGECIKHLISMFHSN